MKFAIFTSKLLSIVTKSMITLLRYQLLATNRFTSIGVLFLLSACASTLVSFLLTAPSFAQSSSGSNELGDRSRVVPVPEYSDGISIERYKQLKEGDSPDSVLSALGPGVIQFGTAFRDGDNKPLTAYRLTFIHPLGGYVAATFNSENKLFYKEYRCSQNGVIIASSEKQIDPTFIGCPSAR